jgi:protein arginine kinase activator
MICQICKDRVATIRLKEIINDVVTEIHMCKECFEIREQEGGAFATASPEKASDSSLQKARKQAGIKSKTLKCPACGTTDEELRANGRLGCGDCYHTFAESLEPILNRVHGFTEHRGKRPCLVARNLDLKTELRHLQEDLQNAILTENYERAAKLRDKIKEFENMGTYRDTIKEPFENV